MGITRHAPAPREQRNWERSLGLDQRGCQVFLRAAFAVILLFSAATPILAQDSARTTTEKWRPKDGVYASPGKDFVASCGESAYLGIELAKKRVGGNEWSCDITKITDTAPGAVKLDMSCNDYNLGLDIKDPNPYERKFKEIMLLSKIDAKTLFVRKTFQRKVQISALAGFLLPRRAAAHPHRGSAEAMASAGRHLRGPR
jgi:hypothetical protein